MVNKDEYVVHDDVFDCSVLRSSTDVQGGPAKVKPTYIYPSKCTNALLFNSAIL